MHVCGLQNKTMAAAEIQLSEIKHAADVQEQVNYINKVI